MGIIWDPVNIINIILCTVIVAMGFISYNKNQNAIPLLIAIAFLIFGVSHIINFIGLADELQAALMIIRILGYLTVVIAMYQSIRKTVKKDSA